MLVWYRSVDLPIWFFLHIYPLLRKVEQNKNILLKNMCHINDF